jgi:hypothetical protein
MFFDQDIAHIARVMAAALAGGLGGPVLPAEYWRGRLHELLDATHLTHAQLCALDSLLLQLDDFEARGRSREAVSAARNLDNARCRPGAGSRGNASTFCDARALARERPPA